MEWGLDGLAETAGLLVSELVTSAVQAMVRQEDHAAVRLQLFGGKARVRIEVWDAGPRPPPPRHSGEDGIPGLKDEGGRGLFLVAALSGCWDLRPDSPDFLKSAAGRRRSRSCRGGYPVRCWYDRSW